MLDVISQLTKRTIYSFVKKTDNVGIGTGDIAFRRSTTIPVVSNYLGPQWNNRRQLIPLGNPGYMKLGQMVVPVGLRGAGIGISGQYAMVPLVKMQKDG